MSILDQKNKVMGKIAALNVINEGLPKFSSRNSFSSINNGTNPVDFLLDLVQSLMGYQELKDNIVDVMTRKLPEIESQIKKSLKRDLKESVSCGVNPSIPVWLRSTGAGIELKLSNIDFFDIMKTDPTTELGTLMYDDVTNGLNSVDFNTYLYSSIELNKDIYTPNGGSTTSWGASTNGTDIVDIRFSPVGSTMNNIVKINANANYDNKTLTDFNNDFIDSITLFGIPNSPNASKILNIIVDNLFGTTSVNAGKTKTQLKKESEINEVLECILNSDENDVIDDSYFEFNNEQLTKIETQVNDKKNGIRVLTTCGNLPSQISFDTLLSVNKSLSASTITTGTTSPVEAQVKSMTSAIDTLADEQASGANTVDVPTIKVNFLLDLIKNFMKSIINIILSPKLMTLFSVNFKILYGLQSEYDGAIDFMKKNKNLILDISKSVLEPIINMLLSMVLKRLTSMISKKVAEDKIEQSKNYLAQVLSMVGVPTEITRQIQGLI